MDAAPIAQPAASADEDAAFLREVRAFLDEALTPDLRAAGRRTLGGYSDIAAGRAWHARLYARGWAAPAWPTAWGGTGWDARRRFLFDRECARHDAPLLFAGGLRSLGPLLIEQGTEAQRARYLPPILSGADLWCQGFSEPGAGSDLAAVACRAAPTGDGYRLSGTKLWTTGAHLANRMFGLFRTADGDRRQEGLTFLLVDMDSPGVTVRPILDLAGHHEFNQVFFDDTPVAGSGRVGEDGDGWAMARRLMQLARANNTPAALVRRLLRQAEQAAVRIAADGDRDIRRALAGLAIEVEAFEQLELALLPDGRPDARERVAPSMLKLVGSELKQKVLALMVTIAGDAASARAPAPDEARLALGADAMARHLAGRAATIYSGSSEVQRDVIARALLA